MIKSTWWVVKVRSLKYTQALTLLQTPLPSKEGTLIQHHDTTWHDQKEGANFSRKP